MKQQQSRSHVFLGATLASLVALGAWSVGCGGPKPAVADPGDDQGSTDKTPPSADLDVPAGQEGGADGATSADGTSGGATDKGAGAGAAKAGVKGAAVTFRLNNKSADQELVFSLDKGWQPVIFAFSGKPPNAKAILMFPKHCTAACELPAAERCPVCEAPDKVKDIKAAETREVVAPGKTLDVPWDGQVHVYEKKKCDCFKKEPVPPETYTVRACGLRITSSAKSSTKYQCVEGSMTFPANGPQVVELDFPKP